MEDLVFHLKLCLHVRSSLEGGESIRISLQRFLDKNSCSNSSKLSKWIWHYDQSGQCLNIFDGSSLGVLMQTLYRGLCGYSIYEAIRGLEEEALEKCKDQIQREIDRLPYLMMIPLLLFMFPAYLILMVGPIVNMLISEF